MEVVGERGGGGCGGIVFVIFNIYMDAVLLITDDVNCPQYSI